MSREHNDHCHLTFGGRNWRILSMRGLWRIRCACLDGSGDQMTMDLSHVRWDEYERNAKAMLARRDATTLDAVFRDTLERYPKINAYLARDDEPCP